MWGYITIIVTLCLSCLANLDPRPAIILSMVVLLGKAGVFLLKYLERGDLD